jgi:hypothetical protein
MSNGSLGVLIGDKHTLRDWGLGWTGIEIDFPEAKTYEQDVPAADGVLDFTEAMTNGDVKYNNRTITLTFEMQDENFYQWNNSISMIANYLAGQKKKIILDTDPGYYYVGRLSISAEKTDRSRSTLVISGDVEPYKYERYSSLEDWIWDSFNFETGIIREYKDIQVDGSCQLNIYGLRKRIVPIIDCSEPMQVTYNGITYDLPKGKSKVFDIWLGMGDNILIFTGNGTVSIDYRGGSL